MKKKREEVQNMRRQLKDLHDEAEADKIYLAMWKT